MIKIWGRTNSVNVKKLLWIAYELNLSFEQVDVGGQFGGLDDPSFLARNPNGLIPLLEDGGTVLWESNVIVRYLAAQYGQGKLWLENPAQRAQAEKWMDWSSTTVYSDFKTIMMHMIRLPQEKRDPVILKQAVENFTKLMRIADNALMTQAWFSGEEFGLGDIPLGCYAYAWFTISVERPSMVHLENWYNQLQKRPAYQKAVMTPLT